MQSEEQARPGLGGSRKAYGQPGGRSSVPRDGWGQAGRLADNDAFTQVLCPWLQISQAWGARSQAKLNQAFQKAGRQTPTPKPSRSGRGVGQSGESGCRSLPANQPITGPLQAFFVWRLADTQTHTHSRTADTSCLPLFSQVHGGPC